jgi:hypothetical protein
MEEGEEGFVPDPMARYCLLLSAALRLCLAVLTSLGLENKEAAAQVRDQLSIYSGNWTGLRIIKSLPHSTMLTLSLPKSQLCDS